MIFGDKSCDLIGANAQLLVEKRYSKTSNSKETAANNKRSSE